MSKLLDKLKKNTTIKQTTDIQDSVVFNDEITTTDIPIINVALSGRTDGGFGCGLITLAGPSKHFKSNLGLVMVKSYLDKHSDAICLFYDSEFGLTPEYLQSMDIDIDRIVHTPITTVEELKFDIMAQLKEIDREDKVIIFIDSIGNLASKKETEDALDQKSKADMTRAKSLKSLWRMVTPHLTLKGITCININHVYKEMCMAGNTLISTVNGLVEIQNISVGDLVYTQNGYKPVTHTYGPDQLDGVGKKFVRVHFDDGSVVECTSDHRFLLENGEWKEIGKCTVSDVLLSS